MATLATKWIEVEGKDAGTRKVRGKAGRDCGCSRV